MLQGWRRLFVALVFIPGAAWAQGTPVGPEFRVNTYTTYYQSYSAVASAPAGDFVVIWRSYQEGPPFSQDGFGIYGQRYSSTGAPLGPEFHVNTYTTNQQLNASVAADSSGNFVVVWRGDGQDGAFEGVFGQRYAGSGAPLGSEFRVNTYTTSGQRNPSVATDSAGNFVVVWQSYTQDGSNMGVFGQRYASAGTPLGPEFRVNTYTTNAQYYPVVSSDPSGNFVVVWESSMQDGSYLGVFGQRYGSSGAPLGPEFRVNTYTTQSQFYPAVAADAAGNFVVAWTSYAQDGSSYGVFGQRFASSGAPLGSEFRVNTFTTSYQNYPSVGADASGNFVIAWESNTQEGASYGVFGQRYAASGVPVGPEFRVNTYTTDAQFAPAVAAAGAGNFVIVWTSQGQDGSYSGIFGQRYAPIVPVELLRFTVE